MTVGTRRSARVAVVACILAGLVAGCSSAAGIPAQSAPKPAAVTSSPAPSHPPPPRQPTAKASPENGERRDQAAAIAVYLAITREADRLALSGGASEPTEILRRSASGFYLKVLMDDLRLLRKDGLRIDRTPQVRIWATRSISPSKVEMTACEDASGVRLLDRNGTQVKKGRLRQFVQALKALKVDGRWKIIDAETIHRSVGRAWCSK